MLKTLWFKEKATDPQRRSWLMHRVEELYKINSELQTDIDLNKATIDVNSRDIAKLLLEINRLSGGHNGQCDQR